MPSWSEIKNQSQSFITPQNPNGGVFFVEQKKKYLQVLSDHTGGMQYCARSTRCIRPRSIRLL